MSGRKIDRNLENPIDNIIIDLCEALNPIWKKLGFTPNTLTFFSLVLGVYGLYIIWTKKQYKLGATLFLIAYVLDCADGNYARKYKMYSKFGDYFDHIGDLIKHTLLFLLIICLDINTTFKIFIIVILAALVLLLNIHLAAQQCYSKNDDSVLNNLKFLCRKKEDIKYLRYFGVGTFELTVFLVLFNLGFIVN